MSNEHSVYISEVNTISERDLNLHRGLTYGVFSSIGELKLNPKIVGELCRQASTKEILLLTSNQNFPDQPVLDQSEIDATIMHYRKHINLVSEIDLGTFLFDQGVGEELIDPIIATIPPGLTFSVQTALNNGMNITAIVKRFATPTHQPYIAAVAASPAIY